MSILRMVAFVVFVAAGGPALAEPVTLVCDANGPAGVYRYDGQITVEMDEARGTVVVNYPGVTGLVPVFHRESHSTGLLVATFSPNSIAFRIPSESITISRVTGEAVLTTDNGATMAENWNCRPGRKQF